MTIIPTFACDKDCAFCNVIMYRNKMKDILSLEYLESILKEYQSRLKEIVIMGGNPWLLPSDYLNCLVDISEMYLMDGKVEIFNILSVPITKIHRYDRLFHHISYDPKDRTNQTEVLNTLLSLDCDFDMTMVVTKNLIESFGVRRLAHLSSTINRKIVLQTFERSVGNDWSLLPDPEVLATFMKEVKSLNDKNIDCKLLRYPTSIEDIDTYFDRRMSIQPNSTFHVSYQGKHKFSNNFDELFQKFKNMIKEPEVCSSCKYKKVCHKLYCTNSKCSYDRSFMEALYGHNPNVSM